MCLANLIFIAKCQKTNQKAHEFITMEILKDLQEKLKRISVCLQWNLC